VPRFGTDGVRGDADTDLSDSFVVGLGRAVARVLRPGEVLIGRDTRASGVRITHGFGAGLRIEGATAADLGVLPTPAIAFIAQERGLPAAVVSASHNPWTDNGVKILGSDGRKLPDDAERAIESELETAPLSSAHTYGDLELSLDADAEAAERYVQHLVRALDGRTLDGVHVVLDCANGAAFTMGPRALHALGARVDVMHASPDGRNINAGCGSTHMASLQDAVRARGATLGIALDGDADRALAVDERGEIVDGDQIMAMLALDFRARGRLRNDAIAVTVMSNLGLRKALSAAGVDVVETPVGDRHVVAAMESSNLVMGGEQSGHIVFADLATTGDGLLTALLVCDLLVRKGEQLSALASCMTRLPQVLDNVRLATPIDLEHAPGVWEAVRTAEATLGDRGRVLVRPSGTEPVVRIMVEAPTEEEAAAVVADVRRTVEASAGDAGGADRREA
jgi:phosphoglucosamine mutase